MKKTFIIAIACLFSLQCGAWSRRNHETIAYIAEQHLTPKAYATVKEILHGQSLVYYAGWMDDFREVELFNLPVPDADGNTEVKMVHYYCVDKKFQPTLTPYYDGLWLICDAVENLYNYKSLPESQNLAYMKILAHLVGDVHCPGHISYADKRDHKLAHYEILDHKGRNVKSFHKFLDFTVLDWKFPGSMIDLAYVCDPTLRPAPSDAELNNMKDIQSGSISEWGKQSAISCKDVFKKVTPGHQLTVEQIQWISDLEQEQILRAGYRLAKILNDLFGE